MVQSRFHINDDRFKISSMDYDMDKYDQQLAEKVETVYNLLCDYADWIDKNVTVVRSPQSHYRNKCRFGIGHHTSSSSGVSEIFFTMWDDGVPNVKVTNFPVAVQPINV
ncbi:unnamed protein product [Sphagnum jensenii]|uniref:Uncharacterized protein n=1 Tax=Sphagnum jensenii TaxID=128206 RepID=A0ABP0V6C6_9BRYO